MIKFFRKIRQQLLTENLPTGQAGKFNKYLIYAIGEVILVVIGILIALSINNKNEARKTKQFEFRILKDIETSLEGNFFQVNLCIRSNKTAIASANIVLKHLEENLPYHDSLDVHFSKSLEWCTPVFNNAGYESLKTHGRNLVTNDTIRENLGIYDTGWMETLGQRQEEYFYNTATPVLTELFEKVAMRTDMKPFEYEQLRYSKMYISILKTSKAYREDQVYWHERWKADLENLYEMISRELKKQ